MKISSLTWGARPGRFQSAFTLIEVMVACGITAMALTALYAGMAFGISRVQSTQQTVRANQIMAEKLDTIRLYAWNKVTTPGFISPTFVVTENPQDAALQAKGFPSGGVTYYGTTTVVTNLTAFNSSYRSNLCEVKISLVWTNRSGRRTTDMTTLVARNGLQNYVY